LLVAVGRDRVVSLHPDQSQGRPDDGRDKKSADQNEPQARRGRSLGSPDIPISNPGIDIFDQHQRVLTLANRTIDGRETGVADTKFAQLAQ
jgi:hypothetical protein